MVRIVIISLRGHLRRVLSIGTAVLLGVAFLAGTLVLGDTMRSGFSDLFEESNAGTDALVRSSSRIDVSGVEESPPISSGVLDAVREVQGVEHAVPVVEASGQLEGSDGEALGGGGPPAIAGNWIPEPDLNPYHLVEGRAPQGPGEVVIDSGSADRGDLAISDTTTVRVPDPVEVTVVGIASFGNSDNMAGVTFTGFATDVARELLLPDPDGLTAVAVGAAGDLSQDELVDRLAPVVPDGVEVISGEEYTDEQVASVESDFVGFFEAFLLVFAGIALVVATFSIYNTFSIVVAQRTRESALFRSLGASRRQVLSAVMVEALVIGVLAGGLGVVAGIGVARGLFGLFSLLDVDLPGDNLVVSPGSVLVGLAVGLVVTLLAGIAPAVKASRVAPMAALRDVSIDRAGTSRIRIGFGLLLVALGAGGVVTGSAVSGGLARTGLSALGLIVGVVMVGPVAARPVSALLGGPLARLRGVSGGLARANAMRNPSRTSGTAAALMVGVAVVGMFTVVGASLKAWVAETVDRSFAGDLVLSDQDFSGVGFNPDVNREINDLPEVETTAAVGMVPMEVDGSGLLAQAVVGPLDRVLDVDVRDGSLDGMAPGTVALLDDVAEEQDVTVGGTVPVAFGDGTEAQMEVAAVYRDPSLAGEVLVDETTWREHTTRPTVDMVFIDLAEGISVEDGRAVVQPLADEIGGGELQDNEELSQSVQAEVDQILAVVYVLLVLAVIIALMSIATTLSLSIHERTRELGLLRAVGQTRRQLRTMVRGEAVIVAAFGTVGGLALGGVLGWALTRAVSVEEEMRFVFSLPVGQLTVVAVVGVIVGLVAALRPARRAAKLDILQALATE